MKISLGYYRISDGSFIADETPIMDTDYYHVFATLRRKICEHQGSSPYRHHAVNQRRQTYCDENRLIVKIDGYKDRKKTDTIRRHWRPWRIADEEDRIETMKNDVFRAILQNVIDKRIIPLMEKYQITQRRYVYLPDGMELNWGIIQ